MLSAPFAMVLWIITIMVINHQSNSWAAYELRSAIIDKLTSIPAVATRGVAPAEVAVGRDVGDARGGSRCKCTCGLSMDDVCKPADDPTVMAFNGTVSLPHIAELRAQAAYFGTSTVAANSTASWVGMTWDRILSKEDAIEWLQHGLLPELWQEVGRDAPLDYAKMFNSSASTIIVSDARPGIFMNWMQIIGGVRLRQRRLEEGKCSEQIDKKLLDRFRQKCYMEGRYQLAPFGPGLGSYAEGFVPDEVNLGAFDVRFNIETPFRLVLETFEYMLRANGWVDDASQSLLIQAAMMNAEVQPPVVVKFEVSFEFERSGSIDKKLNIFITSTNMIPTAFAIMLHVFWAVLVAGHLFVTIFESASTYISTKKRSKFTADFAFFSDWLVIIANIVILSFFIYIDQSLVQLTTMVGGMPDLSAAVLQAERDAYKQSWSDILDHADLVSSWFDNFRVLLFWYTLVIASQFSKIFRGQPKMAMLVTAFSNASEDLLHFVMLFLVLFVSFATGGFMIWGTALDNWSTIGLAVGSTLNAVVGRVNLKDMFSSAPVSTIIWFSLFFMMIVIVSMKILVALVYDHYSIVKGRVGSVPGIFGQLRWVMRDVWNRIEEQSLLWKLTCCCRKGVESIPPHNDMLEVVMDRANLPYAEKTIIRRTVLGAKWQRKERDKSAFAGKDISLVTAYEDMTPDMHVVCEDSSYANSLLNQALLYQKDDYDPEDAKIAQLRQLVANAEEDIFAMKLRLAACSESTRSSMHGLTRRIDELEEMVHQVLSEIVGIANEAGVPTGGQGRGPKKTAPSASALATTMGGSMGGSMNSTFMQTGMPNIGSGGPAARDKDVDKVKRWHRAAKGINTRAKRAAPPPKTKFFGPK
eukprot:TRINITY_DN31296_c0_g1_i1.p1 TRINITY_DN31296_c0_g1~~TRINITY_DN31296_c0_g1_i1.p1  ORF type:complete len:962 (+),score=175.07 TRINITY_DN31296_c0_g1_i1:292-2886(+)